MNIPKGKKQNNNQTKNSQNTQDQDLQKLSDISEELKLEHSSKFHKITAPIKTVLLKVIKKMTFLKKKRFWIPLVIFHIVMFAITGYFAHYQLTKASKPDYIISTFKQSLITKDPTLFNSIVNINKFSDNFISDFLNSIQKYKYVSLHMGEIPSTNVIRDNISFLLLDIVKGNSYTNEFNNKTTFIPKDITTLLADAPLEIIHSNKTDTYIISTTIYDPFWENIPIKLKVNKEKNSLKITKLDNLNEILQIYNYQLTKRYQQEQNFQNLKNRHELYKITEYLPNATCTAQLGYTNKQHLLFINFNADANFKDSNIISCAINLIINNEKKQHVYEKTVKSNKLFIPQKNIQTSWRIPLSKEEYEKLNASRNFLCTATPVMVNAENGDYFDTRKK